MNAITHRSRAVLMTALVAGSLLCGCSAKETPSADTTAPTAVTVKPSKRETTEELTMVVSEQTIAELDTFPNLKKADLTGSTCYDALEAYVQSHPQVEVLYTVELGGSAADWKAQSLTLQDGEFTPEMLTEALVHLPNLEELTFSGSSLTMDTIQGIQELRPEVKLQYFVTIGGMVYDADTEELNLSKLTSGEAAQAAEKLGMLQKLQTVELMGAGGSRLNIADVAQLQAAAPQASFHYTFDLFGKTVSTDDKEIVYENEAIGNQEGAEAELRQGLSILKGCKRFVLDNCKFDNEVLAQVREDFRGQTKVVWRVWFSTDGSSLTDREMLRVTFHLTDRNCHDLVYCEDVKYIDLGHNDNLTNIDYVAGMPNLVAIILSGSSIRDLTPFANCTKLEMLEVAFCGYVSDLSPLEKCYSLERLNIGFTKVKDLSVLDDKNMCVLVDTHTGVSNAERKRFSAIHPDCLVQHSGGQPYGYPWRYLDGLKGYNEYYEMLREIFDYDNGTNTHW